MFKDLKKQKELKAYLKEEKIKAIKLSTFKYLGTLRLIPFDQCVDVGYAAMESWGRFIADNCHTILVLDSAFPDDAHLVNTIAHETTHLAYHILDEVYGISHDTNCSELYGHMVGWVSQQIYEISHPHVISKKV